MEDRFIKYSKLYFLIFLLFISVPVIIALLVGAFWGFSKIISSRPTDIIYELLIMSLPAAIFASVYYIFFKRTAKHPSAPVKLISRAVFTVGFLLCFVVLLNDYIRFFNKAAFGSDGYWSFTLLFLAGNVATLFLMAIIQAFTTNKEVDWMEKRKQRTNGV
jgi:purine-cytosine permease-like protein